MVEENLKNQDLISSVDAAVVFGITNDYVTMLCRQGKVGGQLVGNRLWYVNRTDLGSYLALTKQKQEVRNQALAAQLRQEYKTATAPAQISDAATVSSFAVPLAGVLCAAILIVGAVTLPHLVKPSLAAAPASAETSFFTTIQSAASQVIDTIVSWFAPKPVFVEVQQPPQSSTSTTVVQPARTTDIVQSGGNTYPVIERTVERVVGGTGVPRTELEGRFASLVDFVIDLNNTRRTVLGGRSSGSDTFITTVSGSDTSDFTFASNYGVLTAATSSALWAQAGIFASSTSHFANADFVNATTTSLAVTNLTGSVGDCLTVNASGSVTTTTCGSGGSAFPFTPTTFGSTNANATSTLIGFTAGLYSLASSTIGSGTQAGGLTISGGATTTGNSVLQGTLALTGAATFSSTLAISGIITSTATAANVLPYASSTALTVSGTGYFATASTTALTISGIASGNLLKTTTGGSVIAAVAGTDYVTGAGLSAAYPFPLTGNATSTLAQFNGGLTAFASSTIGNGTQAGGLTISGGATTTANLYVGGMVGIGTTSPFANLSVHANNGSTNRTLFAIGSSTQSATSTLFSVDNTGNATLAGNLTVTSCTGCGGGSSFGQSWEIDGNGFTGFLAPTTTQKVWIGQASSTRLSVFQNAWFGGTATSSFGSSGILDLADQTTSSSTLITLNGVQLLNASSSSSVANIFLGLNAGSRITSAVANTGFGYNALGVNTTGNFNSAFGAGALDSNTTAQLNAAFGYNALTANTTGAQNAAFGASALDSNTGGANNAAFGYAALTANTTGTQNAAFGVGALTANTTGTDNVAVGLQAGSAITTGYANTLIGPSFTANNLTTGFGNIGVGPEIFFPSATGNRQLNIGGILFGTLPATTTSFQLPTSGSIGIGTSTPWGKFSISLNSGDTNITAFVIASSTASATTTLFLVSNTGNVGIGTSSPWRTLSVNGTVGMDGLTGNTGAGSLCLSANKEVVYNSGSDSCLASVRALKHDISSLQLSGVDTISMLESVSFIYNHDASSTVRYGFIADDVELIDPHLATYNQKGELSGVDDRALISIVVKALKELIAMVRGFGEQFTTKKLCVEDVCVTRDQFIKMVEAAGVQPASPTPVSTAEDGAPPEAVAEPEPQATSTSPTPEPLPPPSSGEGGGEPEPPPAGGSESEVTEPQPPTEEEAAPELEVESEPQQEPEVMP